MAGTIVKSLALVIAALSLAPSYAHVLEALPRLNDWPPELWRDATVFHGQFVFFAKIGGPVDVAAIVLLAILAWTMRFERPGFWFALGAACIYAGALISRLTVVAPANAVLATWQPGPIPTDFNAVRARWEIGHMIVAILKLLGFIWLSVSIVRPGCDVPTTRQP